MLFRGGRKTGAACLVAAWYGHENDVRPPAVIPVKPAPCRGPNGAAKIRTPEEPEADDIAGVALYPWSRVK